MEEIRVSGLPLEHICLVICPDFAGSRNENGTYAITVSDIYMFESSQSGGNHCFGYIDTYYSGEVLRYDVECTSPD